MHHTQHNPIANPTSPDCRTLLLEPIAGQSCKKLGE